MLFSLPSLRLACATILLGLTAVNAYGYEHCYYSAITGRDKYIGDLTLNSNNAGSVRYQANVLGGFMTVLWSPTSEMWSLIAKGSTQGTKWYKVAFDLGDGGMWPYYIGNPGQCDGLWGGSHAGLRAEGVKRIRVYMHE